MRKNTALYIVLILFACAYLACEPFEKVSEIPHITFKNFELYATIDTLGNPIKEGELTFDFIDGDADLGGNVQRSEGFDTVNFYLIPFEKTGGAYYLIPDDTLKYTIRYDEKLDRKGQNKTIKGEIKLIIKYYTDPADTLKYDFYVYDRAGHQSNIESTTDIGFH